MSVAASCPPPPPPSGGDGDKSPGHNSPGSHKTNPSKGQKNGDGSTKETAQWSPTLLKNPDQLQYLARSRTGGYPDWMRLDQYDARMFAEMGFPVWQLGPRSARRVELQAGDNACSYFVPFQSQIDEIVAEEQDRIRRHEVIPGEEDILEDVHEEYECKAAPPSTPSKSGKSVISPAGKCTAPIEAPDAGSSPSSSSGISSSNAPARSDDSE